MNILKKLGILLLRNEPIDRFNVGEFDVSLYLDPATKYPNGILYKAVGIKNGKKCFVHFTPCLLRSKNFINGTFLKMLTREFDKK